MSYCSGTSDTDAVFLSHPSMLYGLRAIAALPEALTQTDERMLRVNITCPGLSLRGLGGVGLHLFSPAFLLFRRLQSGSPLGHWEKIDTKLDVTPSPTHNYSAVPGLIIVPSITPSGHLHWLLGCRSSSFRIFVRTFSSHRHLPIIRPL